MQDLKDSVRTEGDDENDGENVVTKELYLCGSCSVGFSSIQECKAHMIEKHDFVDYQNSLVGVNDKVDAETQVEPQKRVGRKKKSEQLEQKEDETDHEENVKLSDSDEDWVENLHSHSTRSHRKRRPPQALKNDYYLGRTRIKEPKKREGFNYGLRCDVKGCFRKFETEELLKKHQEFHIVDPQPGASVFK